MRTLHTPTQWFLYGALAALFAIAAPSAAAAQAPGDPISITAIGAPNVVMVFANTDANCDIKHAVRAVGGTTLFGAAAPGGPILGSAQQLAPPPSGDDQWCPGFLVNGPPPGTYWVAMVYGLVSSINVPLSAWKQVVVPAGCTGVPNPPALQPGQPVIVGSSVSIAFGGSGGCPHNGIDVEIGAAPGQTFATVPLSGPLAAASVPAGDYYLRAYAKNAAGRSRPSMEVPIRVPGPCANSALPAAPFNTTVTVNGSSVSIVWSTSGPVSPTFYQLRLLTPAGVVLDNILLPPTPALSVSGVPPGTYHIRMAAGNACGVREASQGVIFTVP